MMDIIDDRRVITRKEHRCWGCRTVIPGGTRVLTVKSVDGGVIGTARWCRLCEWVLAHYDRDIDPFGDGIPQGIIGEEYQEELREAAVALDGAGDESK